MRRYGIVAVIALLIGVLAGVTAWTAPAAHARTADRSIVFSGFGGSSDQVLSSLIFAPFTRKTHINVTLDASSETIVAKLRAAAAAGSVPWSLMRAEEEDAIPLMDDHLLQPIPKALKRKLIAVLGPENVTAYGPAYIDYSSVLVCNIKLVGTCPTRVRQFWDTKTFPGPRMMFAGGWIDNLVFGMEAAGVPYKKVFPIDVNLALRKLDEIRPTVQVWWANSQQADDAFRNRDVALGFMWSGRAAVLAASDPDFRVIFDGALKARELLVVPKGAPDPAAAWKLVEWYATHPREQAAFMVARRNGLPSPAAYALVPKDVQATLATSPQHARVSIKIDWNWVRKNRDAVFQQWQDWLTK